MKKVNFNVTSLEEKSSAAKQENTLNIFSYAQNRFHQYYLDVGLEECKRRFEHNMNSRSEFEVENEGWDCNITTINFSADGEAWTGDAGSQLSLLNNEIMKKLINNQ